MRRTPARRSGRAAGGSVLIEVMIGVAVLAVALLAQAGSTFSGHRLSRAEVQRGAAVEMLRALSERLRADVDYAGLYERLRLQDAAAPGGSPPSAFYGDFTAVPTVLGAVQVRLQVPVGTPTNGTGPGLREDLADPAFGLPFDLNGDGVVDGASRTGDYRALPVLIDVTWGSASDTSQRLRSLVWVKGER